LKTQTFVVTVDFSFSLLCFYSPKFALASLRANKRNRLESLTLSAELASCLIYVRACVEYVYGCVLFQDFTVREIRGS